MEKSISILLVIFLLNQPVSASAVRHTYIDRLYPCISADSSNPHLEAFKAFADSFFTAVRKEDTAFLKAHILFPIRNSSFSTLDESLENVEGISAKMFFKRLHKLFPANYLKDINTRGVFKALPPIAGPKYIITVYSHEGGLDTNVKWHFKIQNGQFYFETFTSDAG